MFLTSLELSADIEERRVALTRARDHGLDMDRVAIATAERTIEKALEVPTPYLWSLTLLMPTFLFCFILDSSSIERGSSIDNQHAATTIRC